MNGLILHCGGQLKSREEVFAVPQPQQTASRCSGEPTPVGGRKSIGPGNDWLDRICKESEWSSL